MVERSGSRNRSGLGRTIIFKTTFNSSHARIKNVISQIMPNLDCTVCYKKTITLANLCKEEVFFLGPQIYY